MTRAVLQGRRGKWSLAGSGRLLRCPRIFDWALLRRATILNGLERLGTFVESWSAKSTVTSLRGCVRNSSVGT